MSIFKKRETEVEQPKAAPAEATVQETPSEQQEATVSAPRQPGVVPPPATPFYSMRQPAPAPRADVETVVSEPSRMAREVAAALRPVRNTASAPTAPTANRSRQRIAPANVGAYVPPTRRTQAAPRPAAVHLRHVFDPVGAAQAGLLNLAWKWQEAGAPIRAINAYYQVLIRYPGSPGADAAVADLVDLSDKLAHTGQFHIALAIYDHLEELLD